MYVIAFPNQSYLLYLDGVRTNRPEQAMRFIDYDTALTMSLSYPDAAVGLLKTKINYSVDVLRE